MDKSGGAVLPDGPGREPIQRDSKFEEKRKHLTGLSDTQLKERFWELAREIMQPLSELASTHTSPAIERSVVLRMGFSSLEAQAIVSAAEKRGWLGKGVGRILLEYAEAKGVGYLEAGRGLAAGKGWDELAGMMGGGDR